MLVDQCDVLSTATIFKHWNCTISRYINTYTLLPCWNKDYWWLPSVFILLTFDELQIKRRWRGDAKYCYQWRRGRGWGQVSLPRFVLQTFYSPLSPLARREHCQREKIPSQLCWVLWVEGPILRQWPQWRRGAALPGKICCGVRLIQREAGRCPACVSAWRWRSSRARSSPTARTGRRCSVTPSERSRGWPALRPTRPASSTSIGPRSTT